MKFSMIAIILSAALSGCGVIDNTEADHEHSSVHGALQAETPLCKDYTAQELGALDASLSGLPFFNGFSGSERPELLKHFFAVPPTYRNVVIENSKRGRFEGVFKANIDSSGRCRVSGDGPCSRIELSSTQRDVIRYSLIHEFGHGANAAAIKASGLSRTQFNAKMQEFMDEARAHNASSAGQTRSLRIRAYSLESTSEFFADTFHNYYCSPAANNFTKQYLPKNYAFVSTIFAKPMWESQDSGPVPTPTKDYALELTQLYNDVSSSCDLETIDSTASDNRGLFKAKLNLKGNKAETAELSLDMNTMLSRQLSSLRREIKTYFPNCPVE